MRKIWKSAFTSLLALSMSIGGMSITASAAEADDVCQIGDTGYDTLAEAVTAANATAGADTIELLQDIELGSKLTINNDLEITGDYTISRGTYAGTLFDVAKGATLTLDGGMKLDGNNDWEFDSEGYYADMAAGLTLSTGAKNSYTTSKGTNSTAEMFSVKGDVVMNNATIQNNYGSTLFDIPSTTATLTMNEGTLIQHIHGFVVSKGSGSGLKGTWTINDGKICDVYGHNANGALVDLRGGTFTINGGELTNIRTLGLNANGNGILAQVYGESSKLNINGGYIHDNASFSPGNGWGSVVYLNRGGDFTMTGGIIKDTKSDKCTAFVSNTSTSIELLGGTIEVDTRTVAGNISSLIYGNTVVSEDMDIICEDDTVIGLLGDPGNTLNIDGEISEGLIKLMYNEPVTGSGTVTSDVLIKADGYYEFNGHAIIAEANWLDSVITVDAIEKAASLTVKNTANIDGIQVRVLDSVASGTYTNAEEAAAAQAASYVEEAGANVKSPVLYFHRLTSAQKSNVVVTYDYNGGLDAQGWSGCQLTSAESFIPESPAPVKDGYEFIGWKYAVENDPESLSMEGTADYNGEAIATSLRLIAQWYNGVEKTLEINKITEIGEGTTKLTYPLEGIEFEIYYAGTVDEYTDYVKAYVAANGSADEKTIQDAFAAEKAAGVSENDILEVATTDITGKAVSKFREDGIYLIIEREHPAIVEPLDPFVVALPMSTTTTEGTNELVYNVTINPKNEVVPGPEVNKNVTALDTEIDSFAVGDVITWILRGEVPADIANGKSYVMTDVLDDWLDYANNVKVVVANGEEETELSAEDYEYTFDSNTKTFEFELTKAGMKTVADAEEAAKAELEIRVYLDTTLNTKASVGDKVPNIVKLQYKNSVNFDYEDVDDAAAYTCGISIYKYDAKNKATALAGAKFILAKAVSEDTDGAVTLVTNRKEVDYVIYEEFYTSINAEGKLDGLANEIVTDENGVAKIYGLDEGKYYLVETQAPEGYNLLSYPVQINVIQHSDEAPIEVANSNQFKLPATGGVGTTIFTVSGACLMAAAAAMLVMKKRREEMI